MLFSYQVILFICLVNASLSFAHRKRSSVWETARPIPSRNPSLYRMSEDNKPVYYHSYGKASKMGWDVDHIVPKSKGGSDHLDNLQVLTASYNRGVGASLDKHNRHDRDD